MTRVWLSLAAPATAGALAGTALLSIDAVTGLTTTSGSTLGQSTGTPPTGFTNSLGGSGYLAIFGPFGLLGAGMSSTVMNLSFTADAVGATTIGITGLGGPELSFQGMSIQTAIELATINVSSAPEPATLLLVGTGLFLAVVRRKVRSSKLHP